MKNSLHVFGFTLFLAVVSSPGQLSAFPEMVRHGYFSCTSCHFSPNGGGILRPFGRVAARDLLSSYSRENEAEFAYGVVTLPEWLHLGGDVRWVQVYRDTPQRRQARTILMQADLEAAVEWEQMFVVGTIGRQELPGNPSFGEQLISRRHYFGFRPTAQPKLFFRAGRFLQAFGVHVPDHVISTKRGLGWDQGSETYNVEGAWLDQRFDIFVTANFGRIDAPSLKREKGVAVRPRVYLGDRTRAGASYFYGSDELSKRHVFGPFFTHGFNEKLVLLFELDFQSRQPSGTDAQFGLVDFLRVDYEFTRGVHVYATQEYAKLNFKDPNSLQIGFGLGASWFFRPHFEVAVSWQKVKQKIISDEYGDFAWLLLHFYL